MSPKKSLVPEILPDPKRGSFAGGPRQRVIRHVQTVLAGLALGGTALAKEPYTVVDPVPPPARCAADDAAIRELVARRDVVEAARTIELSMYAMPGYRLTLTHPELVEGAALLGTTGVGHLKIQLKPTTTARKVVVPLSLTCAGEVPEKPVLKIEITLDSKVAPGGSYAVTSARE